MKAVYTSLYMPRYLYLVGYFTIFCDIIDEFDLKYCDKLY